jgi:anti-anti-sigma factor
MSVAIERSGNIAVLRIQFESIDAVSAGEIAAAADQLGEVTVLDFARVLFVNSAGISALLKLVVEARKRGKQLFALNLSPHHRKVFEMVDMLRYMPPVTNAELQALPG